MSPQKRRNTTPRTTRQQKRSRLSHRSYDGSQSSANEQPASQGGFFAVRDVIGESRTRYHVDWEDNPITGEKFQPTWVFKSWVTESVVAAWKAKKERDAEQLKISTTPRTRTPEPKDTKHSTPASSFSDPPLRRTRTRRVIDSSSSSPRHTESGSLASSPSRLVRNIEHKISRLPGLQIQVSQHSSFPRSQYLEYPLAESPSSVKSSKAPLLISSPGRLRRSPESSPTGSLNTAEGAALVQQTLPSCGSSGRPAPIEVTGVPKSPEQSADQHFNRAQIPFVPDSQESTDFEVYTAELPTHPKQVIESTCSHRSASSSTNLEDLDLVALTSPLDHDIISPLVLIPNSLEIRRGEPPVLGVSVLNSLGTNSQSETYSSLEEVEGFDQLPVDTPIKPNSSVTRKMAEGYIRVTDSSMTEIRPRPPAFVGGPFPGVPGLGPPSAGSPIPGIPGSGPSSSPSEPLKSGKQSMPNRSSGALPDASFSNHHVNSRLEPRLDGPMPPAVAMRPIQSIAHVPLKPSKLANQSPAVPANIIMALDAPIMPRMEFAVPLPLPGRVRDQYLRTVRTYGKITQSLEHTKNPDENLLSEINKMLERLDRISTHIDLDNPTATPIHPGTAVEDEVNWAVSCSSKFHFLRQLFFWLRRHNRHLAIVARKGQLLDILERFMIGNQILYERPDTMTRGGQVNSQNKLFVSLIASGRDEPARITRSASLVLAFDSSFDHNEMQIRPLRSNPSNPGRLTPVVHLLVHCSIEHIDRSLPDVFQGTSKIKAIVKVILQSLPEFGTLLPEELYPEAAAEEVAAFVESDASEIEWTILKSRPIKIEGIELVEQSQPNSTSRPSSSGGDLDSNAQRKRLADGPGEDFNEQKRPKVSADPDSEVSQAVTTTQKAEVAGLRTELLAVRTALAATESILSDEKANAVEKEAELKSEVVDLEKKMQDQKSALADLQNRYEKQSRKHHATLHEKDEFARDLAASREREATWQQKFKDLGEKHKTLEQELKLAREKLSNSEIPQAAELEKTKLLNDALSEEKASLERKIQSLTTDFEFTRQQYQNASSVAAETSSRITELEAENARLQQKASGEAIKLRLANDKTTEAIHLAQIERLSVENEDLIEQLKVKQRGRGMATRGGSVAPRSPRIGASPPPRSRANSRANSRAPGSRPASPVRSVFDRRRKATQG